MLGAIIKRRNQPKEIESTEKPKNQQKEKKDATLLGLPKDFLELTVYMSVGRHRGLEPQLRL